jgi:hypothetical protein
MTVYLAKGGLFVGGGDSGGSSPAGSDANPHIKDVCDYTSRTDTLLSGSSEFPPGKRVLIVGQVAPQDNGIYVTSAGAWTRAADANSSSDFGRAILVPVVTFTEGPQPLELWTLNLDSDVVLGTTPLVFTQAVGSSGGEGFPLIAATFGTPTPNTWAVLDVDDFTFPYPVPHETRIGFFTTANTTAITNPQHAAYYNGELNGNNPFTIPQNVYVEWTLVSGDGGDTGLWVQRASGNEAAPGGGSGSSGWLDFASGPSLQDGKWVNASNNTVSTFPDDATVGMHVGLWVDNQANGGGATVTSNTDVFYIDRNDFGPGEESPLRGGAWYEWVARSFGEDVRWIPVSGSANAAKPPLEYAEPPFVDPASPNMWVLASNDTAVNLPESPQNGDVFGVWADEDFSIIPANGQSVEAPDRSLVVGFGDNIPVPQGAYYEWIWVESDSTWRPRTNTVMLPPELRIISGGSTIGIGDHTLLSGPTDPYVMPTATKQDQRVAIYVIGNAAIQLTPDVGQSLLWRGVTVDNPQNITLQPGTYAEWVAIDFGAFVWAPAGASNESITDSATGSYKEPVRVVATTNLTLSGLQTVDGVTLAENDRILLTNQTTTSANGIYIASFSTWIRALDANTSAKVPPNMVVAVREGTVNADTVWMVTSNGPINLDSAPLLIAQSGGLRGTIVPIAIAATNAAAAGTASKWAPQDHVHQVNGPYKDTVRVVSTTNLGLTGLVTVDGVTLTSLDRVLAIGQTTASANGIYIAQSTAWVRAGDATVSAQMPSGTLVPVSEGTTYADTVWMLSTNAPITLGTTSLAFVLLMRGTVAPTIVQASQAAAIGTSPKFATNDHIHAMEAPYNGMSGFRLSNNAASPIPVSGSSSNVYIVPYDGYRISLYNGSIWVNVTLGSVLSQVVSGLAVGVPVDVFLAYTGLTGATIVQLNWANATTRATTLSLLSGVYVNSSAPTQRYIGTFLPDGTASYSHLPGGSAICGIWNQNNRIKTSFQRLAVFGSSVPGTPSLWAPPSGMGAPHIQLLNPQLDGDEYSASAVIAVTTTGSAIAGVGIGFDSTNSVQGIRGGSSGSGGSTSQTLTARAATRPASIGVRTVNMLLYVTATGPDFVGNTDPVQAGIIAEHWH